MKKMVQPPKKREKNLYKAFRKVWRGFIERIEPKYRGGIPDLLLGNSKLLGPIFCEMKIAQVSKEGFLEIDVRTSQILWFMRYPYHAFLLAELNEVYYLFKKEKVPTFNQKLMGQEFKALADFKSSSLNEVAKQIITFSTSFLPIDIENKDR